MAHEVRRGGDEEVLTLRSNGFGAAGNASKIKKVLPLSEMAKMYAKGELKQKIEG